MAASCSRIDGRTGRARHPTRKTSMSRAPPASIKPQPFRICGAMRPQYFLTIWRKRHRVHLVIYRGCSCQTVRGNCFQPFLSHRSPAACSRSPRTVRHARTIAACRVRKPQLRAVAIGTIASSRERNVNAGTSAQNAARSPRNLLPSRDHLLRRRTNWPRRLRRHPCNRPSPTPARNSTTWRAIKPTPALRRRPTRLSQV